jgi:hypothetical protein
VPSHPVILLKAIWTIADKRKHEMAQHDENRPIGEAVELLKTNGFDGLAEAVTVLLNSAMAAVLVAPFFSRRCSLFSDFLMTRSMTPGFSALSYSGICQAH